MQTYIRNQDLSATKLGARRQMPQASLPSLNVAVSAPAYTPLTPSTPGTGIMPSITRESLALRLRQNWLAKHPQDAPLPTAGSPAATDDSLTSLNWLQNLNIMKMASPTPPASPQPAAEATQYTPSMQVNPNAVLNMDYGSTNSVVTSAQSSTVSTPIRVKQEPGLNNVVSPPRQNTFELPVPNNNGLEIDYKTDSRVKPPYSYANLICMAMHASNKKKITLAGIYSYITENFLYYKVADPSWQNSIRHNLSLNKCFMKVPRKKEEPGKGGFWKINPEFEETANATIKNKRRGSTCTRDVPLSMASSNLKRLRSDDAGDSDSSNSNGFESRPTKMPKVIVKKEPGSEASGQDVLDNNMDFNWSSLLNQDITVGNHKIKTEDIIDGDSDIASPITDMSPPPSEGSNSENILDDFLLNSDLSGDLPEPLDFTTGGPLDLSISGINLKAPEWWNESLNGGLKGEEQDSGLHTPVHIAQSPAPDAEYAHPWAEDRADLDTALASFGGDSDMSNLNSDISNLFDEVPDLSSHDS